MPPADTGVPKTFASVGILVASLRNPYYVALLRGAEAEARRENPTVLITSAADEYSALKQIGQIDDLIGRHVELILLTPADPDSLAAAIGRAQAAGALVVALDTPATGANALVATDNVAAGELACRALAERLGGHGSVAVLRGPDGPAAAARFLGCTDALSHLPGISVVSFEQDGQGTRDGSYRAMRAVLGGAAAVDAVFAPNDAAALGAADAVAELSRPVIIASVEGSPGMEAALANRARAAIVASVALDPFTMGRAGVRAAADLLNGRAVTGQRTLLDPVLVTRETVGRYQGWTADRE